MLCDRVHPGLICEVVAPTTAKDGLDTDIQIDTVRYLGSYHWTETRLPTIAGLGILLLSPKL